MVYFNIYILILLCIHSSKSYRSFDKKIIDGKDVPIKKFPHSVFLEILATNSKYICGSSVLNQFYLITVAHCVYSTYEELLENNGKEKEAYAFAGHENINKATVYRTVKQIIIHKKYSPITIQNDIALLLLIKELPLGESIKRIILKLSFPKHAQGTLTGWGLINEITEEETLTLKSITQTVKNRKSCAVVGVTQSTICAGSYRDSSPRAAAGDSGGGLITSKYQLLGLLSFKVNTYPALPVYTNASYYYEWIKKNTQYALCKNL